MRPLDRSVAALAALLLAAGAASLTRSASESKLPEARSGSSAPAEDLRLPPDRIYQPAAGSAPPVTFSHATHAALVDNKCLVCHPGTFKLVYPAGKTSHEQMDAGKSCGLCHNGKDAFGTQAAEACESCHQDSKPEDTAPVKAVGISAGNRPVAIPSQAPEGAAAPAQAGSSPGRERPVPVSSGSSESASPRPPTPGRPSPPEVKLAAGAGSPGPVTFRHSSHAKEKCNRCHPALFPMKASATPLDYEAMKKGATCGACHDGKQAFGVEDSDSCEKCHAPAGGKP